MLNKLRTLLLAGGLAFASTPAHAASHYRGRVFVSPMYRTWGYSPFWWGYPDPYFGGAYAWTAHPHQGQVRFDAEKGARVFIDGAYAGTVKEVNSAWLPEGSHSFELRFLNGQTYAERIYIASGRTVHVQPELQMAPKP